jgi:hypothetical protein
MNLHPHELVFISYSIFASTYMYPISSMIMKLHPHEPVGFWLSMKIDPHELK